MAIANNCKHHRQEAEVVLTDVQLVSSYRAAVWKCLLGKAFSYDRILAFGAVV
jgi:hypothetical protein